VVFVPAQGKGARGKEERGGGGGWGEEGGEATLTNTPSNAFDEVQAALAAVDIEFAPEAEREGREGEGRGGGKGGEGEYHGIALASSALKDLLGSSGTLIRAEDAQFSIASR